MHNFTKKCKKKENKTEKQALIYHFSIIIGRILARINRGKV